MKWGHAPINLIMWSFGLQKCSVARIWKSFEVQAVEAWQNSQRGLWGHFGGSLKDNTDVSADSGDPGQRGTRTLSGRVRGSCLIPWPTIFIPPVFWELEESEFKDNKVICLAEEISTQMIIQEVVWFLLLYLSRSTLNNNNNNNKPKVGQKNMNNVRLIEEEKS